MRKMKRLSIFVLIGILLMSFTIAVSAQGDENRPLAGAVEVADTKSVPVSYGLCVLAEDQPMIITGISGSALDFSVQRFACAMNLANVENIKITRLPEAVCGSLYIGSLGVSVGQTISASELALMTYEEASSGVGSEASFDFTVNNSSYEMTCVIRMIDSVNYSPTVNLVPAASLYIETYQDVKTSGVLSAYDPEDDAIIYEITKYPEHGRLIMDDQTKGTYTYLPDASYVGEDCFYYVARDEYGNYSASAEVKLGVEMPKSGAVYSDLLNDAIYRSPAIAMTELGVMNGIKVGDSYYFEADREVSRAEFLVTAMSAIGIQNLPEITKTVFSDDEDIGNEIKGYVALAYSKGYISGIKADGEVYFRPNDTIQLSEAAVILSNIIGYAEPKIVPVFADADKIPAWSEKAIESLHALGILETPDMYAEADREITRGEMAKLLQKTIFVIGK